MGGPMFREYVGLLDDKVNQYSDASYRVSQETLNEYLVRAVLFGRPLLINDGYLLRYEAGIRALQDEDASPLLRLLTHESGFIKLLSRNRGKLHELFEKMAKDGVGDCPRPDGSPYWKRLLRALEALADDRNLQWQSWPDKKTDLGFVRLFDELDGSPRSLEIEHVSDREWSAFASDFRGRFRTRQPIGARTAFEASAHDVLGAEDKVREAMRLGNEIYHYNLAALTSTEAEPVGVLSIHSRRLGMMRETVRPRPVEDRLVVPSCFRQLKKAPTTVLCEIVRPGSALNRLKESFLGQVEAYAHGSPNQGTLSGDLQTAAKDYAAALAEEMKDDLAPLAPLLVRFFRHPMGGPVVAAGVGGLFGFAVSQVLKDSWAGAAAKALASAAAAGTLNWAARNWRYPLELLAPIDEADRAFLARVDHGLVAGSVALDRAAVARHQQAVPAYAASA